MKKRIINVIAMAIMVVCTTSNSVLAAQKEVEDKINSESEKIFKELEEEEIREYEEAEIDERELIEKYRNLEITLPEEFLYVKENLDIEEDVEEADLDTMKISTYAANTVPSGIYTLGTKTSTTLLYSMSTALSYFYDIGNTVTTTYYTFGNRLADSFVLPGMANTNVRGLSCDEMIPQGIEAAGGYIFITAYCESKEHNSVIYVLDSSTKKYITTLVMPHSTHSGGIAYADSCLWVCSGNNNNGKAILYYYSFLEIKEAIEYAKTNTNVKSIYLNLYTRGKVYLRNQEKCSFITAYKDYICVGEYYEDKEGCLGIYNADATDGATLTAAKVNLIPEKAQGAAIYSAGNNIYMIINTSSGIICRSKIFVYCASGTQLTGTMKYKKYIEMPKMVEEAMVLNGKVYFVFESGSNYWGSLIKIAGACGIASEDIVGKVCGFTTSFIFK